MRITPYHAKYFAYELTRQGGDGVERLSRSLFDACVDLNPHQIEAALFAIRSPISKGVLLADEVGLGKTIEAGLVLCQYWAERKRRLLVICPASIRKQWALELEEKFNLATKIIDAKSYREAVKNGSLNPFEEDAIIITSMHYASRKIEETRAVGWDLVVIDEAHKLRNAYRKSNKMGQNIRWAVEDKRKILLTATPLQNSLLELYGLSTIIDERIFGDLPSFRTQYVNMGGDLPDLRDRLQFFCQRTLRSQVLEYIQYTQRKLITQHFQPTDQEQKLYEAISNFLKREGTYAIPDQQRHLTTLVVRKLLASSSRAVAGTLKVMRDRLIDMRDNVSAKPDLTERIIEDEEIDNELLDEILDNEIDEDVQKSDEKQVETSEAEKVIRKKLNEEIDELGRYIQWAESIGIDTKAKALLKALDIGFEKMAEIDASQKAVVFTESIKTQMYLKDFLENNGYADRVITFNGTNRTPESTQIYEKWVERQKDSGRVTDSRAVDVRMAIIEHFQNNADIMIATEAAAEGINLQFCSLVINFDLPWNPQRIEQRIGRCHRYGQKHDVVVINFLNQKNRADCRVYELLNSKFNLFTGVFGASDEVLGSIESGLDFEKRIFDIYQQCRTVEEIETAFTKLQNELDDKIESRINDTRRILLENFDEDVHARLKVNLDGTRERLDNIGRMFWRLTRFILNDRADFDNNSFSFELKDPPVPDALPGTYHMISKSHANISGNFLYRLSHPLGEYVIESGKNSNVSTDIVQFDISNHPTRISVVESLKGQYGWLTLQRLKIKSFDDTEYLLFSGFDNNGASLDQETCEKLFNCKGNIEQQNISEKIPKRLSLESERHAQATISRALEENSKHFNEARERLEKWADDMVIAAEKELKDTKAQIKTLNRQARQAENLEQQRKIQEKIKQLERKKRRQRQQIFDIEDEIMEKRDKLIDALEKRLEQKTAVDELFTIRWAVV